ncbi:MAG: SGNH/GDSL hydrolase family protein [Planctomycetaceae bacterium]
MPFRHPFACVLIVLLSMTVAPSRTARAEEAASESPRPQPLKEGDRVVFLGDSITQAGAGDGGYVTLVREAIANRQPELGVEIIGAGISGNRVPDLQRRLERDVLAKKPTVCVIYIGINDVWHLERDRGTSKEDYEAGLNDLLVKLKDAGVRAVLCTPSVIGEKTDGTNKLDGLLDEYSAISSRVAERNGVQVIDLRVKFIEHLKEENEQNAEKNVLTTDGVHLNAAGNEFVAERMLEGLGVARK